VGAAIAISAVFCLALCIMVSLQDAQDAREILHEPR